MTVLIYLWSKFQGWIIGVGAILAVLAGAYAKGRMDQKTVTSAKTNEKRLEDIKEARKIDEEIKKLPPDQLNKRLDRWMRD